MNQSTSTKGIAPLSLSTVKVRYPRLFTQYTYLSNREMESMDVMGDKIDPKDIDSKTGLCTKIGFDTDFNEPLEESPGCPLSTHSDGYKLCMFLWNCLNASETGSIGGDACRQYDILNSALDDTLSLQSLSSKFEHLLGWTVAAYNHGLEALLYRGDPDRNRALFKAAADEWKVLFEKTENNAIPDISEALRKYAIMFCDFFQKLLKQAKKEYGDHAKYTFNFIKKKRVKKGTEQVGASVGVAKSAPAGGTTNTATISVMKPSIDTVLGIGIAQVNGATPHIKVTSIAPTSIFQGTALKVGMVLESVNSVKCSSFVEGSDLLRSAEGQLVIVVSHPKSDPKENSVPVPNKSMSDLSGKRKANGSSNGDSTKKAKPMSNKAKAKAEAEELINRINAVEGVPDNAVYDSCPQVKAKINAFLERDGMTKATLLRALGGLNSNSLSRFLAGKGQDQCASVCYKAAYVFFEKLRILEGKKKTAARLKNEAEHPSGFSLHKSRGGYWKYLPSP